MGKAETTQTLSRGMSGAGVKELQRRLNLIADGIFGPSTEEAVREFQRSCGLSVDGVAGPATQKALALATEAGRRIDEIILHCTGTPEGEAYSVEEIRKWHLQRGFSDIGYHYVIYLDGTIHKGRDIALSGAHCTGHNTHSIGVCYVGGCPPRREQNWQYKAKDTRTAEQKAALRQLVSELKAKYPGATVHGHNEFANKQCPSFKICDL